MVILGMSFLGFLYVPILNIKQKLVRWHIYLFALLDNKHNFLSNIFFFTKFVKIYIFDQNSWLETTNIYTTTQSIVLLINYFYTFCVNLLCNDILWKHETYRHSFLVCCYKLRTWYATLWTCPNKVKHFDKGIKLSQIKKAHYRKRRSQAPGNIIMHQNVYMIFNWLLLKLWRLRKNVSMPNLESRLLTRVFGHTKKLASFLTIYT